MMEKIEFVTNMLSIVMGLGQVAAQVRRLRSSGDRFANLNIDLAVQSHCSSCSRDLFGDITGGPSVR